MWLTKCGENKTFVKEKKQLYEKSLATYNSDDRKEYIRPRKEVTKTTIKQRTGKHF